MYQDTPTLQWDVDLEDIAQADEEEELYGLVGIPLDEANPHSDSNSKDFTFDVTFKDVY